MLVVLAFPLPGRAERVSLSGEFNFLNSDSSITNKATGQTFSSTFSGLNQYYNLDFSKTLYPYLALTGGTSYKLDKGTNTSQSSEVDTTESILRPYVRVDLDNPLYKAGIGYIRTQREDESTGSPATSDTRDEINTVLGWRPDDFPEMNLRYTQTHTSDDPETVDFTEKRLAFDTSYTAWEKLELNYYYSRDENEDRLYSFDTLEQNHSARIDYADDFFNRRLSLSTGYRIRYQTLEFPGSTTASIEKALTRDAGLTSQDNTPQDGPALSPAPALIDGNVTASAGIDIGLAGDETTLTNIGVDLGTPVEVSSLHVWVDRRPSASVAGSFVWDVYTSPDNTDTSTWTQVPGVSAVFDTFENRFKISFPAVTTRFIKAVTRPLSPAIPDAALFPNIFITEMQAFATVAGNALRNEDITINHDYNLNLSGKLGERTNLGTSLYYSLREEDPSNEKTTQLSNDVYLSHIFNQIVSASASVSRSERETNNNKTVSYTYGASIRANYLKTLNQTLTYSAIKETDDYEGSSEQNTILLRTNANLYDGWSAYLDTGYNWNKPQEDAQENSTIIRTGMNVVPNEMITINLNYKLNLINKSVTTTSQNSRSEWDLQALITPFKSLSLNIEYNVIDQEISRTSLQNYTANWSPFPDGALQFFLTYNERLRPEDDQKSRTIGPGLKWTVSRHVLLDMYYNITESETSTQLIDSKSFSARLKISF